MLNRILETKRAEVARMLAAPDLAPRRTPAPGSADRLARPQGAPLRLLAEVKHRSPSAGELSRALSPADRALCYAAAGAAMISVLCDHAFFDGSYDDLAACRDALDRAHGEARPRLLCKEFIVNAAQLVHAEDAGADAVLLIARIVTPAELQKLAGEARRRGLEPFVEVATEEELAAAVAAEARIIGVNARDLDTLSMDPERAARVLAKIPAGVVRVHLSGLGTAADVSRVAAGPADAALIGEALMRKDDPGPLLSEMVAAAGGASG